VDNPAQTSSAFTTAAPLAPKNAGDGECEVFCNAAQLVTHTEFPDHHARAEANADQVFVAMHDDLLACYKARVRVDPNAHAFLTVDVVIGPDGRVRNVETTGGALLGNQGLDCIVNRVKAATFEPLPGGGTRRIHVPLTFRRVGLDEGI
jgi:hypothetical protein